MKPWINWTLGALIWSALVADRCYCEPSPVDKVAAMIAGVLEPVRGRRKLADNEALQVELAAEIVAASDAYGIDPILLSTVAFYESTYRSGAVGDAGEVGIIQLLGVAKATCPHDMDTRQGQLMCGARWLAKCREMCGDDDARILTAYASGHCTARTERTRWMIEQRIRMIQKWDM